MKDKDYTKIAFIALALFLLWWLLRRKAATQTAPDQIEAPTDTPSPELATYAANPDAFAPASLGTVDINIGNQGLGYLSNQYIPLFGFVGMAQGVMFQ